MATPGHQSSLEGLIDFSAQPVFSDPSERARAIARFHRIVGYLETIDRAGSQYNRPVLIRLAFEYVRSSESQDSFLEFFFRTLSLDMLDSDLNDEACAGLREPVIAIVEFLMTNFFLPLRASTNRTPQPSPIHHAALHHALSQEEQQRMHSFVGTPERLSALREACLVCDRHRCIVSHALDAGEAARRFVNGPAIDDVGDPLIGSDYQTVKVAHIIPYALAKAGVDGRIHEAKKTAIAILNMFDLGVVHLIEVTEINRPYNAITLSSIMHLFFGNYKIFFKGTGDDPHTYQIGTFLHPEVLRLLPVTRTLFTHLTIDPPSGRLLALHYAIAHILHLSGAGDYIDRILRDMEDGIVRGDGSTELEVIVDLALRVQ